MQNKRIFKFDFSFAPEGRCFNIIEIYENFTSTHRVSISAN